MWGASSDGSSREDWSRSRANVTNGNTPTWESTASDGRDIVSLTAQSRRLAKQQGMKQHAGGAWFSRSCRWRCHNGRRRVVRRERWRKRIEDWAESTMSPQY
jgi:hypothetical protein